jgi:hypothetical protein
LAKDLWFADDQRIKRADDAEYVLYGRLAAVTIQVAVRLGHATDNHCPEVLGEGILRGLGVAGCNQLGPIASGQQHEFGHVSTVACLTE